MLHTLIDLIFPPREDELLVRNASLEDVEKLLDPRIESGIISLLPFKNPLVQACIHECKYYKNKKAIYLLGSVLSAFLTEWFLEHQELEGAVFVTYVPLSKRRHRARGYNQVEEIIKASGWKYESVLEKVRDTIPQTKLSRKKRLENLQNAFRVLEVKENITYIIIDDVTTTGTTLQSIRRVFSPHENTSVILLSLAH